MQIAYSNLWESKADIYAITTNSFIKNNGELVMGRGAALEAKNQYSRLAYEAGERILQMCGHLGEYNWFDISRVLPSGCMYDIRDGKALRLVHIFGMFQVKYHFKDKADLDLIYRSTLILKNQAQRMPYAKIAMNFPGIGNGGLSIDQVLPIVQILPDNVTLHIKE